MGIKVLMLRETSKEESLLYTSALWEAVIITDSPAIGVDLFRQHSYGTVSKILGYNRSALTNLFRKSLHRGISAHNVLTSGELLRSYLRFQALCNHFAGINLPFSVLKRQDSIVCSSML